MKELIQKIKNETTVRPYSLHGYGHWERVAEYARFIAAHEEVNEHILGLFAYFHDCRRLSDGTDPEHGPRAAKYIQTFPKNLLKLEEADIERLMFACRYHTYEVATDDLTIKACWDSDRLDLGRVGIRPDPKRLFTQTAVDLAAGRMEMGLTSVPDR
ncbi:MAG: hypothetical protein ACL93V_07885 [Candidatus Electrothrix sp. YB6]